MKENTTLKEVRKIEKIEKIEGDTRLRTRHTKYKFNNEKDFINYNLSFFCEETYERMVNVVDKFLDEIGKILEEDRKQSKKKEAILGEE